MGVTEVREQLAAAASTVDGARVAARFRQFQRPGDGAVRMARLDRPENGFGLLATWQVWVLLPQDPGQAEEWSDERAIPLFDALSEHMRVASVTPQQLNAGGQTLPCLVIEGSREQE